MIISGYQGIGKSTLADKDKRFIDLESSNFFVYGVRPEDWYIMYGNVAISLSKQGYDVFISSHKEVRDYLEKVSDEKLVVIFPSLEMKESWILKLSNRYIETQSKKDLKALNNARLCYTESIKDLSSQPGFLKIILTNEKYQLRTILDLIRQGIHTADQTFVVGE